LDGVGLGHTGCCDGVTGLVVGDQQLFAVGHHTATAFWPTEGDAFDGVGQLELADLLLGATSCQNGGFVDGIGQICARESGGQFGNHRQVDIVAEGLALGMDAEDCDTTFEVRCVEDNLAVEAAWADQGWVEHVGTVSGSNHDDVGVGVEAVHLDQDLVERLFALVV
jgi:hypothetical protein